MASEKEAKWLCDIVTNKSITIQQALNLLCCALEGGSNYWYMIEGYELAPGLTNEDFHENGKMTIDDGIMPWSGCYAVAVTGGCAVLFSDKEGDDPAKRYRLDAAAMKRGFEILQQKYPRHWADFVNENEDAETGDVWLQCCLFGEAIYG